MNKIYLVFVMTIMTVNIYSQNPIEKDEAKINYVDDNNLKQGLWTIFSENDDGAPEGDISLECKFIDGKLDGVIRVKKGDKLQIAITPNPNQNKTNFKAYKRSKELTGYLIRGKKGINVFDMEGNEFSKSKRNWLIERLEFLPLFYGGTENLMKIIHNTVNKKNTKGKKGSIHVVFMVDENGYIKNPKVVNEDIETKDSDGLLATEALRIVNLLPRMQPGFQGSKFVKVPYKMPIHFR